MLVAVDGHQLPCHLFGGYRLAVVLEPDPRSLEDPDYVESGALGDAVASIVVTLAVAAVAGDCAIRG
ncbi:hypothetical protein [Mycolicibacterium smegmatis]|uniref:hypothetical protein n=1 Tax=Mycolicibacterium smegmatis TaxID=1772 RepID=UPI0013001936|nr:hypothetical protein [Mycolicibacterium smegmatis]